jgi:hypothetical protein
MWKNIVEKAGYMTLWRMHIACWIPKATHTHTHSHSLTHSLTHSLAICNNYCFYTVTVVTKSASLLRYVYIACLVRLFSLVYCEFTCCVSCCANSLVCTLNITWSETESVHLVKTAVQTLQQWFDWHCSKTCFVRFKKKDKFISLSAIP